MIRNQWYVVLEFLRSYKAAYWNNAPGRENGLLERRVQAKLTQPSTVARIAAWS